MTEGASPTRGIDMEKPGKTTEKILHAARAVFAEKGYSGTHVDEIAARAGVNKATLYYQIGDKDTLYAHVIHQVLGNIAGVLAEDVGKATHPAEKLKTYINGIAAAVDKNPELPSIMMREMAGGGAHLPRVVIEDIAGVLAILQGILEDGRKKGIFEAVSPFLIHMMIMGTILFYKKGAGIQDQPSRLAEALRVRDRKLKGHLGNEVGKLVFRAIRK